LVKNVTRILIPAVLLAALFGAAMPPSWLTDLQPGN
jgi:hypothetical protein